MYMQIDSDLFSTKVHTAQTPYNVLYKKRISIVFL